MKRWERWEGKGVGGREGGKESAMYADERGHGGFDVCVQAFQEAVKTVRVNRSYQKRTSWGVSAQNHTRGNQGKDGGREGGREGGRKEGDEQEKKKKNQE